MFLIELFNGDAIFYRLEWNAYSISSIFYFCLSPYKMLHLHIDSNKMTLNEHDKNQGDKFIRFYVA